MGAWKDATVSISRKLLIDTVAHVAFDRPKERLQREQRRGTTPRRRTSTHPRFLRHMRGAAHAPHARKKFISTPAAGHREEENTLEVKGFRELMEKEICGFEQKKLLRSLENQPITGRIEISRLHQKVFAEWKNAELGNNFLREDPAAYNYYALLAAIKLYDKNMRENNQQADELVLQIKEERRIERLKYKEKTPISVRLKGIHAELIDLRRQGLSWTQISTYLYRRHRKYFGARKLSPDYIRRVFLRLEKERSA